MVEQCGAKRTGGERQLHGVQELSGRRQLLPQWMTMFALQLRLDRMLERPAKSKSFIDHGCSLEVLGFPTPFARLRGRK